MEITVLYFSGMSKTILVAGKNSNDGEKFSDGLAFTSRKVVMTEREDNYIDSDEDNLSLKKKTIAERKAEVEAFEEEKKLQSQTGICTFPWNPSSALSARNLVLQTENFFEKMDEAVLYFDEEYFASNAQPFEPEEIARSCDELILGFQYLTSEIINRFERKNNSSEPGSLVFLIKEGPCALDALKSPAVKNGSVPIASPLVAAAAAAFTSFAENICAVYSKEEFLNIYLVRGDSTFDEARKDDTIGKWLGNYLDAAESSNGKQKKNFQWIKIGAKPSGSGFSLFRKK